MRTGSILRKRKSIYTTNKSMLMILLNIIVIFFLSATNYGAIAFIFPFLYLIAKEIQKSTKTLNFLTFFLLSFICDISASLNVGYIFSIIILNYFFVTKVFKTFNLATYFVSQALAFAIVNFMCFSVGTAYIKWFFMLEYNLILFAIIYIHNIIRRNYI